MSPAGAGGTAGAATSTAIVPAAGGKCPRVFQLQPQKGVSMGYYRSAEGAALAYARSIGIEASASKAAKVKAQPRAQAQASSLLAELGNVGAEEAVRRRQRALLTQCHTHTHAHSPLHVHACVHSSHCGAV